VEPREQLPVPPTRDEVARLGTTLNAMLDRIGAAMAREREFVADASHELRTPLAVLKAELELALREGRSREELEAALSSAAEETDRLTQLAEDLLVIAQTDQGQLPVRISELPVSEVLEDVRRRFARRAADTGRRLSVNVEGPITARVDRLRIEQALGNMVDNALRYGAGPVRLDARAEDGHVELHVRDEGPGFPPEFLARAFDRFARSGRGPGTGLGLAIVAAVAAAHGGSAHAANTPEGGADVWLVLSSPFHEGPPASPAP
jgi:two-component system OmpR family sensor kinase